MHQVLKITSQSLKLNEKLLMTQYIAVQCHQYSINVVHVCTVLCSMYDLAII